MVNKIRLIKLLQQLIRINSENPPGNEYPIACFVKKYLSDLGLKCQLHEFKKNRSNIIAYLNEEKGRRSLLITPHLDTVPSGDNWNVNPFSAKIIKGKIYGLGATDCKVNIAVSLEAIKSIVEQKVKLSFNLIFAATADEECGSDLGLIPLLDKKILKPDAALVLDADDFDIVVTQKGLMHLKVIIKGRRAHGAYPWLGVNAIDIALEIIKEIKSYKFLYRKNKFLRSPTINVGTIKGGDKVNIVADRCEFELDFRFLPGSKAQDLLKVLKGIIKKHSNKYKIEIEGIQEPYSISQAHPLVKCLKESVAGLNIKPRIKGSEGATVITFFQHKNIPAIATGFGFGGCAHTANEYVRIESLYKGAKILENFLKKYSLNDK